MRAELLGTALLGLLGTKRLRGADELRGQRLEELSSLGLLALEGTGQLAEQNLAGLEVRKLLISSADSALPSRTPPLMTRFGFSLAKSRRPFADSTGSPVTKATAVGPLNRSSSVGDPGLVGRDLGQRVLHHGVLGVLTERTGAAA